MYAYFFYQAIDRLLWNLELYGDWTEICMEITSLMFTGQLLITSFV
jgi:hypothetical protein